MMICVIACRHMSISTRVRKTYAVMLNHPPTLPSEDLQCHHARPPSMSRLPELPQVQQPQQRRTGRDSNSFK